MGDELALERRGQWPDRGVERRQRQDGQRERKHAHRSPGNVAAMPHDGSLRVMDASCRYLGQAVGMWTC